MKTRSQSSPSRKKAKVSLSPPPMAPQDASDEDEEEYEEDRMEDPVEEYHKISAGRYQFCAKIAEEMVTSTDAHRGVYCTRREIRERIRHMEGLFVRAHTFSVSNAGLDMIFKNSELFHKTIQQMCPHYYTLFPVLIHFLDELEAEHDGDDASVASCEDADPLNGINENGAAYAYDEYKDSPEYAEHLKELEADQVRFRKRLFQFYRRLRSIGFPDRKIFQKCPELVVAEFPKGLRMWIYECQQPLLDMAALSQGVVVSDAMKNSR